ncbi:MAG: glycosyltransferase [Gemmatimonadaceae bacterium]|nr:glycosyltransferase [Gloeobacterales cyanobacterium ES-bin-141]
MDSPLVSVVIPAYNAVAYIGATLDSVLSQTYENIEVLVVDDGSQDRTLAVIEAYCRKDGRVILLRQPNLGVAAARNLAIQASQGTLIAPLDADDIWYPHKLERQVQCFLDAPPQLGLVYSWFSLIDEAGSTLWSGSGHQFEGKVLASLVYQNFVGNASVPLIRRDCFEKVGVYSTRLREHNAQGCEDWDLYLRIAEHYDFQVVPELLVGYRQVNGSMACNSKVMARSYHLVMEDSRGRCPEVPEPVYLWSSTKFYLYLMSRCYGSGDYPGTLSCLYRAVRSDFVVLLWLRVYAIFLKSTLMLATQPLRRQIGRTRPGTQPQLGTRARRIGDRPTISKRYQQIQLDRLAWVASSDSTARPAAQAAVTLRGSLGRPTTRRRLIHLVNLLSELVSRDIKVQYQRSALGVLWSLVSPLMQLLIFVFLFNQVLSVKTGYFYPSFTFSGMLAWAWFQMSLSQATGAVTSNRELVRQPGFPAPILPVVTVTTNLIYFLIALPILAVLLVAGGSNLGFSLLALPVVLVVQFMLTLGFAYLLSSINVVFRDTQHIVGVCLQLLFYLTPVFYDPATIPERYRFFLAVNPMAHLIEAYRAIFLRASVPDIPTLGALVGIAAVLLGVGHQVFVRVSDRFIEEL